VHGDLHARNVRVRANDAVVIDFARSDGEGPLIYDLAMLEASLLIDAFSEESQGATWVAAVKPLYRDISKSGVFPHAPARSHAAWFFSCVRQIRLEAAAMQRGGSGESQYATALAVALLLKACKAAKVNGSTDVIAAETFRRGAALFFADQILTEMFAAT
jgi:Ser/Thr protein kinase RdoA (MazF antagonist)